jgi:hypothetical protein
MYRTKEVLEIKMWTFPLCYGRQLNKDRQKSIPLLETFKQRRTDLLAETTHWVDGSFYTST